MVVICLTVQVASGFFRWTDRSGGRCPTLGRTLLLFHGMQKNANFGRRAENGVGVVQNALGLGRGERWVWGKRKMEALELFKTISKCICR